MRKIRTHIVITALVFALASVSACTRSADRLPEAETATQPAVEAAGLKEALPEEARPEHAQMHGLREVPIESDYSCKTHLDCTYTKYANVPHSPDDCECAAACTPFVVNAAEKERRETANLTATTALRRRAPSRSSHPLNAWVESAWE